MKSFLQLIIGAAFLSLVSGCAFTQASIGVGYAPQENPTHVTGAENVSVSVGVKDQRLNQSVGRKIDGYGMECASIIATNDIPGLVKSCIETELDHRGFKFANNGNVSVDVELAKFYNEFRTGILAGSAAAELDMNVMIKNNSGTILYSRIIEGQGKLSNIEVAGGNNARIALEAALKDGMNTLFSDPAFTDTLLKAGQQQMQQAASSAPAK